MVRHLSSICVARALSPLLGMLLVTSFNMRAVALGDAGRRLVNCGSPNYQFKGVTTSGIRDGTPFQSYSCPGGGTLRYLSGAATSVTFMVGAELELQLSEIYKAGVSRSVSFTTTTASAGSGGLKCPEGPWTCALIVIPKIHTVSRLARKLGNSVDCGVSLWANFVLTAPDVDNNNVANLGVEICICKNKSG